MSRVNTLLPATLASLARGGFDNPRVFLDGAQEHDFAELDVVCRYPAVRCYANWYLALLELYLRAPQADRFAIFQDDVQMCRNVKAYLDTCSFPERGYWNLFTFRENDKVLRARPCRGFFRSDQCGRGALALVFDRKGVEALLSNRVMVLKPQDVIHGHQSLDGCVAETLARWSGAPFTEWCHSPSLVQHTGVVSTMAKVHEFAANTFPGESFDAALLPPCSCYSKWKVLNSSGGISTHIELMADSSARKHHAPTVAGEWKEVGHEFRIEWSDGYKDSIMRLNNGSASLLVRNPGTPWEQPPNLTLQVAKC